MAGGAYPAVDFIAGGVQPQPQWPAPTPAPAPAPRKRTKHSPPATESGLRPWPALAVTAVALGLSGLFHWVAPTFIGDTGVFDTSLRRDLAATIGFYVFVGVLVLGVFALHPVRVVWQRRGVGDALAVGLPIGVAGGLFAVGIDSLHVGHLASDPTVELLVGGGGALRIGLTLIVVSALAPLVEETIFRGICAGSLLDRHAGLAIGVSAVAFAVWHFNPIGLRYYAAMGLVFGLLWWKRGLLASISAHAMFNGVLTLAAVAATGGAGATAAVGGLATQVPGGWHARGIPTADDSLIIGPAGASLALHASHLLGPAPSVSQLEGLLAAATVPGVAVEAGSVRSLPTTVGTAVTADINASGQPGHVLEVAYDGDMYQILMVTAGSPAAESAWHHVTSSLRPR
jgi:membrane protease YdiL (CAAX protease family)